jgi:NAD(P)-dependent dehydrogenase (short-subunit alcohol dehydrogenase family)
MPAASALVTGAASGLGAATAARLRAESLHVVGFDRAPGAEAAGDVLDEAAVDAAVGRCIEAAPLRVAVACAGVGSAGRLLGRDGPLPLETFRRTVDVNLVGAFNTLRLAAAAMARNDADDDGQRGVIVLTASIAAFDGQIGQVAYAASKAGIAGIVLPAARDLARDGIRVVAIAPGIFDTPLLAALPEAAREALGAAVPNPARLGRPDEFAALVWHIVSNPMLNGETIRLDGALRMAPR